MSILLCVSIAWAISGLLFLGLGLILLLIIEHASNAPEAMMSDERISDQARQLTKRDLAVDEPIQKARELADTCDELAQSEDTVTLAPRAIPTAHRAIPDRTQHSGALIIRDPRLTRARTLSDQSGVGLNATFVFPTVCGGRDAAA